MQKQLRTVSIALLLGGASAGFGQAGTATTAPTPVSRFLSHFDLGVSADGVLNSSVTGTAQNTTAVTPQTVMESAGSTVGVVATLRARKSAYVGAEFNYTFAKYAETLNFTPQGSTSPGVNPGYASDFKAQSTVNEYTFGYVARPEHTIFGAEPFLGGGAGVMEFKPTKNGGNDLPVQARAAYYYALGADSELIKDFGLRVGFRQVFFLAPDFGQNYLKIKKLTSTVEPTVGFYYHF